jgi:hypothetical protein
MIGTYSDSSLAGTLGWLIWRGGKPGSLPGARKLLANEWWSNAELEVSGDCTVDRLPKTFGRLDKDECALRTNLDRRFGLGGGVSAARECSSIMGVFDSEWFNRLSSLLLRLFQGSPPSSEALCGMTGGDISRAGGGMTSRSGP